MNNFWDKVRIVRGKPNKCWNWHGAKSVGRYKDKYGTFRFKGKLHKAHRIAYAVHNKIDIELLKGKLICHSCDNTLCCNPRHLFLGTNKDNSQDMCLKGHSCKGEHNGRHRLTEAEVISIKQRLKSENCAAIAREFNVHPTTIDKIKQGKSWCYLNQQKEQS